MASLEVDIGSPKFEPLIQPARYKGIHGGRGSGKSHFFAMLAVANAIKLPGARILCVREVQKSLKESAKRLIEDKIITMGVGHKFEVLQSEIKTPGNGVITFTGMQDHTAESVKSYEGYDIAWIEEARSLSQRSLTLLRPTIRKERSEIWASWNPGFARDPIDELLRGPNPPPDSIVVEANWNDNEFFPATLDAERLYDKEHRPEQYGHIWEGEYAKIYEGAYYADQLEAARKQDRIGTILPDPLMQLRAYWDIGGTGSRADATSIWVSQFVGKEIRVLNYYEAVGQQLADHAAWLRSNGYEKALCKLPHDGANHEKINRVTYASALREAGFTVEVLPNAGGGAAMQRVEAGRRRFPIMFFNEATTQGGREALGAYHEKRDEARGVGLGPEHDWSSHAADSFGAMAMDYEEPTTSGWGTPIKTRIRVA